MRPHTSLLLGLGVLAASTIGGCTRTRTVVASPSTMAATATLRNAAGATVGSATLTDTPAGVLVTGSVDALAPGGHGIHVHAVGQCTPTFAAAGPHFNPNGKQHGFRNPSGHHAGDMPNVYVPSSGSARFDFVLAGLRLQGDQGLLDADGASLVVHAGADDYITDPAGNSGDRIACGVISAR